MKFAIIMFPGTNCERDMYYLVKDELGHHAEYVWHSESGPGALDSYDAIILPGGSSYSDALRPGCIASVANIIPALRRANEMGKPILGVCNGFQILTEAKLLPGILLRNPCTKFICKTVPVKVESNNSIFTNLYKPGQIVNYPIAHASGNYYCDNATLQEMKKNGQILFTYVENPSGSVADIAGITNKAGNVLGMMPHPERAVNMLLGNDDGLALFMSLIT